jgi:hypothetical protein
MPPPVLTFRPDQEGGVPVDLARLLAGRLLIQGSSGAGKSYAMRYLLEQTSGLMPQLVIDWEGEFHTLRTVHPYIVVGQVDGGADLQVSAATARVTCRRLIGARASVIVDLSDLADHDARREVAALWLDELMSVHQAVPHVRMVVVDEIQELCPQGETVASSAAVKALAARGRKRGLGMVSGTQRLSKVHKDAAEVQNLLVGLTTLDVDMDRAARLLGYDSKRRGVLADLEPGQFLAMGRALPKGVTLVRTGEVRSPHPDAMLVAAPPPTQHEIAAALQLLREQGETPAEDAGRQELLEINERLRAELQSAREGNTSDPADIRRAVDQATSPLNDEIRALRMTVARMTTHARMILLDAGEHPEEGNGTRGDCARNDGGTAGDGGDGVPGPGRTDKGSAPGDGESCGGRPSGAESVGTGPGAPPDDRGPRRASVPPGESGLTRRAPLDHPYAAAILEELRRHEGAVHRERLAAAIGASSVRSSTFRSVLGALKWEGKIRFPRDFHVAIAEAPT